MLDRSFEFVWTHFISILLLADSKVWHFRRINFFHCFFAASEIRLDNQILDQIQMKGISEKKKTKAFEKLQTPKKKKFANSCLNL